MADPVATEALFVDGVRAHNPGDVVPAANVKANGWDDQVAAAGSKAAKKAQNLDQDEQPVAAQAPPPK